MAQLMLKISREKLIEKLESQPGDMFVRIGPDKGTKAQAQWEAEAGVTAALWSLASPLVELRAGDAGFKWEDGEPVKRVS